MSSELSKLMLARGFDLKQNVKDRRDADSNQKLAQLLQQGQINQRQAQTEYYNKQSRGQQLENTQLAQKMARGPQNEFERIQSNGQTFQVETGPNGQALGDATLIGGMGRQAPKVPTSLFQHLPPELQGNPNAVTTADLIQAAKTKKVFDNRPDPMAEMNQRQAEQKLQLDQEKIREADVKYKKGQQLGEKAKSLASELLNHSGLDSSIGTIQGSWLGQNMTVDSDSQNFINKHNQLKSILTAENLDMMTGVLSETDIKILSDIAGGGLQLKGSEQAYRDELISMGGVLDNPLPAGSKDNGDGTFTLPNGMIVEKE